MPYAEVITDDGSPPANPARGYRLCLESIPTEASHLVVVQDDAIVASSFRQRIEVIAEERPDDIVILCVLGIRNLTYKWFLKAAHAGEPYSTVVPGDFHYVVGVLWPREKAEAFSEWMKTAKVTRSDDQAFGNWAKQTRQKVIACVPSVVEHPDDFPSSIDKETGSRHRRAITFSG
jgi:hypothetical protein